MIYKTRLKFPNKASMDFYLNACWPSLSKTGFWQSISYKAVGEKEVDIVDGRVHQDGDSETEILIDTEDVAYGCHYHVYVMLNTNTYLRTSTDYEPKFFVLCHHKHSCPEFKAGSGCDNKYRQLALMFGDPRAKFIRNTKKARIVKSAFTYFGHRSKKYQMGAPLFAQWSHEAKQLNRFPLAQCAAHYPEVLQALYPVKKRGRPKKEKTC